MTGKVLISVGICVLYLLSCRAVSNMLLGPLEKQHPLHRSQSTVKFVVVLGGGITPAPQIPVTSQLSSPSVIRLMEGIRTYRDHPGARLIFTGKKIASAMAETARAMGIDENDIIIEGESRDTKDEAGNIRQIVGTHPFVLVTSASHLPRAMALFEKQGMNPEPVPTEYLVKEETIMTPKAFCPGGGGLRKSERAFYEYLGWLWAKLRGQI